MKRIILRILSAIVLILFIHISFLIWFEMYHKNEFMKECLEDGRTQEWCEQTWQELSALD